MACEHAELVALAFRHEAAAEAVAQRQRLEVRCVAVAVEQRCEQFVLSARAEGEENLAEVGRLASELRSTSEKAQLTKSELRSSSEKLQLKDAEMKSMTISVQNVMDQLMASSGAR